MHILEPFKDKRSYSFDELLALSTWDNQTLTKLLIEQIKRKTLHKKQDIYTLNKGYFVGRLDLKEGFGFLLVEPKDLYLENRDLDTALDGDLVLVKSGRFNKVIEVLERSIHEIVCTVKKVNRKVYLTTKSNLRLPVRLVDNKNVLDGEVLQVKLVDFNINFIGGIIKERIGFINDPDIDVLSLVYEYGFPYKFSKESLKEAQEISSEIKKDNRTVVEDEYIITIDGEDAKDLDDAISLKVVDGKYHLSIHIADVSHYVKENSEIDKEAYKRGTSAYLADRVIPMLPQRLSNDLCSLNEDEKYTLSVFMVIDEEGKFLSHEIKETVIRVDQRLSYDEVNEFLNGASLNNDKLEQMLNEMLNLSKLLFEQRYKQGSLEFESVEYQYILDDENNIVDIKVREHGASEKIIEEFMILTNQTVGTHLFHLDLPSIYRVHEKPKEEKLKELFNQLRELNIKTPKHKNITPKTLQAIIEDVKDDPNRMIVHEHLLKSMNRAKYTKQALGHFGLAIKYYSHFTAPIRRYPDLLLHRIVKDFLINPENIKKRLNYYESYIEEIALHSSKMERLSIDLEREVDKLKIAEFMSDKIGNIYDGTVSGITKTGIFVKIEKGIEGMILVRTLDDHYHYNEEKNQHIGEKNKKVFKLGTKVTVKLTDVNIELRQITFQYIK